MSTTRNEGDNNEEQSKFTWLDYFREATLADLEVGADTEHYKSLAETKLNDTTDDSFAKEARQRVSRMCQNPNKRTTNTNHIEAIQKLFKELGEGVVGPALDAAMQARKQGSQQFAQACVDVILQPGIKDVIKELNSALTDYFRENKDNLHESNDDATIKAVVDNILQTYIKNLLLAQAIAGQDAIKKEMLAGREMKDISNDEAQSIAAACAEYQEAVKIADTALTFLHDTSRDKGLNEKLQAADARALLAETVIYHVNISEEKENYKETRVLMYRGTLLTKADRASKDAQQETTDLVSKGLLTVGERAEYQQKVALLDDLGNQFKELSSIELAARLNVKQLEKLQPNMRKVFSVLRKAELAQQQDGPKSDPALAGITIQEIQAAHVALNEVLAAKPVKKLLKEKIKAQKGQLDAALGSSSAKALATMSGGDRSAAADDARKAQETAKAAAASTADTPAATATVDVEAKKKADLNVDNASVSSPSPVGGGLKK